MKDWWSPGVAIRQRKRRQLGKELDTDRREQDKLEPLSLSLPELSDHDLMSIMTDALLHLPPVTGKPPWPGLSTEGDSGKCINSPAYRSRHSLQPPKEGKNTYNDDVHMLVASFSRI